jgi:hypothetical protein
LKGLEKDEGEKIYFVQGIKISMRLMIRRMDECGKQNVPVHVTELHVCDKIQLETK